MNIINSIREYFWLKRHPLSKSSHLKDYIEIAVKFDIPVERVYLLAHGSRVRNLHEQLVMQELKYRGIIG